MDVKNFYDRNLKNKRFTWKSLQKIKNQFFNETDILNKKEVFYFISSDMYLSYSTDWKFILEFKATYPETELDDFRLSRFEHDGIVYQ